MNLIVTPFGGGVYPVNPTRSKVCGIKAYKSIKDVPEQCDLAVICIPAKRVLGAVTECGEAGVRGLIIISAGFKEVGKEGAALEEACLAEARKYNMRVIGPNCLGAMVPTNGLNASFASTMALKGEVAFISQSGALMCAMDSVCFSAFVSIGSMADVNWGDLIYYFGNDPKTKAILIYMESIGNARSFISAAREVALRKPIIVIKPGRTAAAALTAGVVRVDTIEQLFDIAAVLDKQPLAAGPRMTVITNAGGPGVITTDEIVTGGGQLAKISPEAMEAYNSFLPGAWSHNNPVDVLGDAPPEMYAKALKVAGDDKESDGMLVILTPQSVTKPTETAVELAKYAHIEGKPVFASWMGGRDLEKGRQILREAGIPVFGSPDVAAKIFNYCWEYSSNLNQMYEEPRTPLHAADTQGASKIIEKALSEGRNLLTENESKQLLASYGIPVVQTVVCETVEKAQEVAEGMKYPVVVKLNSETITHKSDVGGVQLNIKDKEGVATAWNTIRNNLEKLGKLDGFQGVTVQRQLNLSDGYELIFGSNLDSQVGPVIVFGTGGTLVEVYKDSSMALPPLNTASARHCMEKTKIYKALKGVRGKKPCDLELLDQVFVRFSELIADQPWIKELDINPMLATPTDIIALDARVVLHAPGTPVEKLSRPSIRGYPHQYVSSFTTSQGVVCDVRPIRPDDETAMKSFEESLSEESVKAYMGESVCLETRKCHKRLAAICHPDFDRQVPLIALVDGKIVGTARMSKLPLTKNARILVEVADSYQKQGLGKYLMEQCITIAKTEGVEKLTMKFFQENAGMTKLATAFGFEMVEQKGVMCATKVF
ncbi:acetyl synthetase subunit alpha [Blastocystis sp. subtype 4]|uniref:acetyl synthetase subunit alpha n=1 Tax=Blastocystis sp. subtype 4 TaxID=944170 RepID=UPI00071206FB|nr:acetyl synthetase subunit alpha [Blastocystis sp. subtype 4]KNB41467.1 acetyl synthetase subunit alpha [Blastocystis sp. subtype 4]|eukprot:XP_014524910.1 acetyl synthetase subunit alpha [Blastocystis sp. subtype 4]